ncbi:MAG: acyl-CoA thioesterase [Magnetococcales bacterium]|nr:acyl-CoA thioesterase [Magnetococcales bacterium]
MENYALVLPEHLNHYGHLHGGELLKWVDEAAYIAARLDYPACQFVTVAMDKLSFQERIQPGTILRFSVECTQVGNTSIQYTVQVSDALASRGEARIFFSTQVTYVNIGPDGAKQPLPPCGVIAVTP